MILTLKIVMAVLGAIFMTCVVREGTYKEGAKLFVNGFRKLGKQIKTLWTGPIILSPEELARFIGKIEVCIVKEVSIDNERLTNALVKNKLADKKQAAEISKALEHEKVLKYKKTDWSGLVGKTIEEIGCP